MKLKSIFVAAAVMFAATPAIADTAVGVKVGTLGLGVEVTTNVIPMFLNARVLASGYDKTFDVDTAGVPSSADLKLSTVGAILDVYPFAGKFRVSGGLFINNNKLHAAGTQSYTINGTTLSTTLTTDVTFNKVAPYVGIGYGDAVSDGSPIGFNIELGVLAQGSAKVKMHSSNMTGLTQADIDAEAKVLENDLKNFKYYPMISAGMTYKF